MGNHAFNFDGGEELTKMGATWFVSYAYYTFIDNAHINWQAVNTSIRIKVFTRTEQYYRRWLERILEMNDDRLNTNEIGLEANRTKELACELLAIMPE
jgi:hypothetical protein